MLSVFPLAAGGMYPRKCSIFPLQKGEGAVRFLFLAAGGTYPLPQHLSPCKRGDAVRFVFASRRGRAPVTTASFPLQKGEMLFVFCRPLGPKPV